MFSESNGDEYDVPYKDPEEVKTWLAGFIADIINDGDPYLTGMGNMYAEVDPDSFTGYVKKVHLCRGEEHYEISIQ
ncbi:MAG: hypothetical protein WA666_03575 [Nitrospirota bacterium]